MSEDTPSQSNGSELAQDLWRRYTITPGTIQRLAILQPIQSIAAWSIARTPLLSDVQRRWLPGQSATGPGNSLELPFTNFANPVSRVQENAFVVQRKAFSPQDDQLHERDRESKHSESQMIVPAATIANESSESLRGSIRNGNNALDLPFLEHLSGISMVQSVQRKIFAEQAVPLQAPSGAAELPDRKVTALPEIELASQKSIALGASATGNENLGVHLLQRHLDMPVTQAVQRKMSAAQGDQVPSRSQETDLSIGKIRDLAAMPSNEHFGIFQGLTPAGDHLPIVHGLQRQHDSSPPSATTMHPRFSGASSSNAITNRLDFAIRRSVASPDHSDVMPSQLPLARPVQTNVEAPRPNSLIQMSRSSTSFANYGQASLTHLIQRQSQSSERPAVASSGEVAAPTTHPVTESIPAGAVDIEKIADQILRILLRQMTVERERRGIGR